MKITTYRCDRCYTTNMIDSGLFVGATLEVEHASVAGFRFSKTQDVIHLCEKCYQQVQLFIAEYPKIGK